MTPSNHGASRFFTLAVGAHGEAVSLEALNWKVILKFVNAFGSLMFLRISRAYSGLQTPRGCLRRGFSFKRRSAGRQQRLQFRTARESIPNQQGFDTIARA
jgi:hypothetical protein